jgi:transporter family-2 protein
MGIAQPAALALLGIGAGVSLVIQQALNADLSENLASAAWAGLISYIGGTLCMAVLVLATGRGLPQPEAALKGDVLTWTGGFWGAVYIGIAIFLIPRLGAATFIALLVAGQMLSSLVFDHYGLLGLPEQPASPARILGALLLLAGVILIRS